MNEEKIGEMRMKDNTDTFLNKLQQASTDLDSVKSSFSKGMEDLAKIQSMLNLDGLTKMDSMIRSFEDRLSDSERRREEAVDGARRYSMELEKEKDRLVKLWDAYKNQEESLSMQEKRVAEVEEKLRTTDQVKMQFEQDATARIRTLTQKLEDREQDVQQVADLREQVMRFDTIRTQLEENVDRMRSDLITKDEVIRSLENQVDELAKFQQFAEFKTKFEEVSTEYEKEKERLTKLFRLYEETEAENKTIKQELHEWQSWFDSNEELFTKLFSSVEHLKHRSTNLATTAAMTDEDIEIPPSLEQRQDQPEKPKRRLRFRK
jgi:chromosome segregation ATPase